MVDVQTQNQGDLQFQDINWAATDEITSDRLNQMIENDDYVNQKRLSGRVRNVDPSTGQVVPGAEIIQNNLITVGGYLEFSPPDQFDPDNDDRSTADRFTLDVNLPSGAFNPAYQPVVIPQVGVHQGSLERVNCVVKNVSAEIFTCTILKSIDFDFSTDQKYFLIWIATGVAGGLA